MVVKHPWKYAGPRSLIRGSERGVDRIGERIFRVVSIATNANHLAVDAIFMLINQSFNIHTSTQNSFLANSASDPLARHGAIVRSTVTLPRGSKVVAIDTQAMKHGGFNGRIRSVCSVKIKWFF